MKVKISAPDFSREIDVILHEPIDGLSTLVITHIDTKADLITDHVLDNPTIKSESNELQITSEKHCTPGIFTLVSFIYGSEINNLKQVFEKYDGNKIYGNTDCPWLETPREEVNTNDVPEAYVITGY